MEYKSQHMAVQDQPGAATAALNCYRAWPLTPAWRYGSVSVPTLYVYAGADVALGRKAADLTHRFMAGAYRYEVLDSASHWFPETEPMVVTELLLQHFRGST